MGFVQQTLYPLFSAQESRRGDQILGLELQTDMSPHVGAEN